MKKDIKAAGIPENTWYKEALHREKWHQAYNKSITEYQPAKKQNGPREIQCNECGRCFRTEGDKVRHKCLAERMKPVKALLSARLSQMVPKQGWLNCPRVWKIRLTSLYQYLTIEETSQFLLPLLWRAT